MFRQIARLNPQYNITRYEFLSEYHQKKFKHLKKEPSFYGLLHASSRSHLPVKAISKQMAALFLKLRRPARINEVIHKKDQDKKMEQRLIRLVLDAVLEIKQGEEFISGQSAIRQALFSPSLNEDIKINQEKEQSFIQALSIEAIKFAISSPISEPLYLSHLLYRFNRLPLHRRWQERFPDERATSDFLNLDEKSGWHGMPSSIKPYLPRKSQNKYRESIYSYWWSWRFKKSKMDSARSSVKLYFSPFPEDLPEVFRIVREAVIDSESFSMKIGRNIPAILRPDKLIVYFKSFSPALKFAQKLIGDLSRFCPQGVPFTSPVDPKCGLVSLGVDPPRITGSQMSWRSCITEMLALAVQSVHRSQPADPLRHIFNYMQTVEIDCLEWKPLTENWYLSFDIDERKKA